MVQILERGNEETVDFSEFCERSQSTMATLSFLYSITGALLTYSSCPIYSDCIKCDIYTNSFVADVVLRVCDIK